MMNSFKTMSFLQKKAVVTKSAPVRTLLFVAIAFFIALAPVLPVLAYADNAEGAVVKSTDFVSLNQGKSTSYTTTIKNTGKRTWKKGEVFLETGDFLRSFSKIQHVSWLRYHRAVGLTSDVLPGKSVSLTFSITAPADVVGDIQQNFQLVEKGEQPIKGTTFRLFVLVSKPAVVAEKPATPTVTAPVVAKAPAVNTITVVKNTIVNSPVASQPIKTNATTYLCSATGVVTAEQIAALANCNTALVEKDTTNGQSNITVANQGEPMMRIGLFSTTQAQRVTHESASDVLTGSIPLFSGVTANDPITVRFSTSTKQYGVSVQGMTKYSFSPIRIIPRTKNAVATLPDYRTVPQGSGTKSDNRFRNIIEFQYSTKTKNFWVINELPLSYYLKGLGETSAASPVEFQKVMLAAARTYAMYHYNRGIDFKVPDGSTKHADEHFHLDATYDQVYRGFGSESRIATLVQAENETRGMVVTYNGKIIVTPYFSRSDGRTRSYTEVWGGTDMPWLKSVVVPQDAGQTLWGHGVGMSARGALLMVVNDKKSWDSVIKYFYQGTEIKKLY